MTKNHLFIGFLALAGFIVPACTEEGAGGIACQMIYNNCEDQISADEDDFVEECVDEYADEDADCKDALNDFGQCARERGCDDADCVDDYWDIGIECGFDALEIPIE
ncbi:MAG: hypothetical protein MUC50_04830 [Myxococcota bacterium]|jgi:hypothetical protein|nr:hypothetical protein [Myxococcota bacterium]